MSTHATAHTYTIKEAASLTGLPASTLRYYKSIGIISPVRRDPSSKQRIYTEEDLHTLTSVACLNATGMPIEAMRTYIQNSGRGAAGANGQMELLAAQQRHLAKEAASLRVRQKYVDLKIAYWQAVAAGNQARAEEISAEARLLADALKAS